MFLIISPAFFSYFFCRPALVFWDPPIGFPRVTSFMCPTFVRVHVLNVCGSLVLYLCDQNSWLLLYSLSVGYVGHCGFCFLSHEYFCPVLLVFLSTVYIAAATFRLHNSACNAQFWSSCCLNFFDKFPFFLVNWMNAAYLATVSNTKFMKAFSPWFKLLALPYPAAPSACSSSSISI